MSKTPDNTYPSENKAVERKSLPYVPLVQLGKGTTNGINPNSETKEAPVPGHETKSGDCSDQNEILDVPSPLDPEDDMPDKKRMKIAEDAEEQQTTTPKKTEIYLTLSAEFQESSQIVNEIEERHLIDRCVKISWVHAPTGYQESGDYVALYNLEPTDATVNDFLDQHVINSKHGYYVTNHRMGRIMPQDKAINYPNWVAYISKGIILSKRNMRIFRNWMNQLRNIIGDLPLRKLMLIGCHNAGSYMELNGSFGIVENQEECIYSQLIHGIRFLDLRVLYRPLDDRGNFWLAHSAYATRRLEDLFVDLMHFIKETNEVVILGFHSFEVGFNDYPGAHDELAGIITSQLRDVAVPPSFGNNVTLNQCWTANKNVIICYEDKETITKNSQLFWEIEPHVWANTLKVDSLKEFLFRAVEENKNKEAFFPLMAQLTPNFTWDMLYVIGNHDYDVRKLAALANAKLTKLYLKDEWRAHTNIICVDLCLDSTLLELAFDINSRKKDPLIISCAASPSNILGTSQVSVLRHIAISIGVEFVENSFTQYQEIASAQRPIGFTDVVIFNNTNRNFVLDMDAVVLTGATWVSNLEPPSEIQPKKAVVFCWLRNECWNEDVSCVLRYLDAPIFFQIGTLTSADVRIQPCIEMKLSNGVTITGCYLNNSNIAAFIVEN